MKTKTDKVIEFISTFEMYEKEESGIKPYTIRKLTDRLFIKLEKNPTHLRIRKGYTKESFTRKITHNLEWGEWIILSWNPNEQAIKKLEQEKDKEIAVNRSEVYDEMNKLVKDKDEEIKELKEDIIDLNITITNNDNIYVDKAKELKTKLKEKDEEMFNKNELKDLSDLLFLFKTGDELTTKGRDKLIRLEHKIEQLKKNQTK